MRSFLVRRRLRTTSEPRLELCAGTYSQIGLPSHPSSRGPRLVKVLAVESDCGLVRLIYHKGREFLGTVNAGHRFPVRFVNLRPKKVTSCQPNGALLSNRPAVATRAPGRPLPTPFPGEVAAKAGPWQNKIGSLEDVRGAGQRNMSASGDWLLIGSRVLDLISRPEG
jgi:hypothetical protein